MRGKCTPSLRITSHEGKGILSITIHYKAAYTCLHHSHLHESPFLYPHGCKVVMGELKSEETSYREELQSACDYLINSISIFPLSFVVPRNFCFFFLFIHLRFFSLNILFPSSFIFFFHVNYSTFFFFLLLLLFSLTFFKLFSSSFISTVFFPSWSCPLVILSSFTVFFNH